VIVVKVGGSLYDLPDLGDRLRRFLATLEGASERRGLSPPETHYDCTFPEGINPSARRSESVLVFPGGGITADAVRELDRVHRLGDEASHWMALAACSVNGMMLAKLLDAPIVDAPTDGVAILDPYRFAVADEGRPGRLPHCWGVTSDSMAARAAAVFGASELVLLKSVEWRGEDWRAAAKAGVVDPFFSIAVAASPLRAVAVDLRRIP
jgi:5-(aminomethyl)-3-furanmethanol phosphate kinase